MKSRIIQIGFLFVAVLIMWKVGQWSSGLDPRFFTLPTQAVPNTVTPQPTRTSIQTPTETPIFEATSTPTPIPSPTPTKTPTTFPTATPTTSATIPSQITNLFNNAKIISYDKFDSFDPTYWTDPGLNVKVANGVLDFTTSSTDYTMRRRQTFHEGNGILFDLQYTAPIAGFEFAFAGGVYKDPNYRLFGINRNSTSGIQGVTIARGSAWDGIQPAWTTANTWYRVFLGVSKQGDMLAMVWPKDKPQSIPFFLRTPIGKDARNLDWIFFIRGSNLKNQVTISWTNYLELDLNQ